MCMDKNRGPASKDLKIRAQRMRIFLPLPQTLKKPQQKPKWAIKQERKKRKGNLDEQWCLDNNELRVELAYMR